MCESGGTGRLSVTWWVKVLLWVSELLDGYEGTNECDAVGKCVALVP